MIFDERPPLSRTDKLCLLGVAALIVAGGILDIRITATDLRSAHVEKHAAVCEQETCMSRPGVQTILEALDSAEPPKCREDIPLASEIQIALMEACRENGVPVALALGLIEVESNFDPKANNGLCVGLMQLNTRYYPGNLTPAENIAAGVAHLAGQIERYGGDIPAALRAYNRGYDDGDRAYANAVLAAAEKWREKYEKV